MSYRLPLAKILKGRMLKIAEFQDLIIIELSRRFDFVLRGGTAVWRIYNGKRFSYDIDIYYNNPEEILKYFFSSRMFKIIKSKLTSSKFLYLKFGDDVVTELEVSPLLYDFKVVEADFWLVEGGSIVVKTLTPENLLAEKVNAFKSRRKSRDLYDIYYLLDFCEIEKVKPMLKELLPFLASEPNDFNMLSELIILGRSPSFQAIVEKVNKYAKQV
ncbi:MAG: nucleotidyl transferase AbiEii/AbiGii toxin family protein [Nitrososphaeria archaeon]|nr:nucleotidyl transferase AbiEii/AbiGii toxin family protein [Nitrososphaeria archaeon]